MKLLKHGGLSFTFTVRYHSQFLELLPILGALVNGHKDGLCPFIILDVKLPYDTVCPAIGQYFIIPNFNIPYSCRSTCNILTTDIVQSEHLLLLKERIAKKHNLEDKINQRQKPKKEISHQTAIGDQKVIWKANHGNYNIEVFL